MAKRKKSNNEHASEEILGHDPFDTLDMEWLHQEEGELSIKVLGQDPFEDLDVGLMGEEWMDEGQSDQAYPELAQEERQAELGTKVTFAPSMADVLDLDQVVVEHLPLEQVVVEPEPQVQTERRRPAPTPPPTAVEVPTVAVQKQVSVPQATFHFPAGFKWGVATSAHQVEGENILNDWWTWEQAEGHIKGERTSGLACDWWQSTQDDFDRAAEMGLGALRLSVEWSRIEPRPGHFDDSALARYREMLQSLRERGIEPMVTLHHFSNPRWLAEQGGWEAPETVPLFARFARRVADALGRHCDMWCTINEPNVYGYLGYLQGTWPPGQSDLKTAMRVIRHMLLAHAAAYREIHAPQPNARVGLAHNMRVFDPANPRSPLDQRVTRMTDGSYNQAILTALTKGQWRPPLGFGLAWQLRRTLDWIGLNYYTRDLVAFDRSQPQELFSRQMHADAAELLDGGYGEFYPHGIFRCIQRLARLGLPIYVTENGIPDDDDDQRPRYLLAHLHKIWQAIQFCYPVMGYYHWTLVDNFEWAEGWTLRFGLIELDPDTQVRRPRRSADLYADIARANAITSQSIDTYAPDLRAKLLPG